MKFLLGQKCVTIAINETDCINFVDASEAVATKTFIQDLPKVGEQNGSKIFLMTLDQNLAGVDPRVGGLSLLKKEQYLLGY